jgi:UDP-N-acetylmuramate--alanine ligase
VKLRSHLIGIGGSGMSGAAQVLLERGFEVSGSDQNESAELARLREAGALISRGHAAEHVERLARCAPASTCAGANSVPLVVRSLAVPDTNPECVAARALGWPVLSYAELLGRWSRERSSISIAGTHGKTTTTSMTVALLDAAGVDPGFVIGGRARIGAHPPRSACWGAPSAPFVLESCEYGGSFHHYRPRIAAVTNVEADHLDYYGDFDGVRHAFRRFAAGEPDAAAPRTVLTVQAAEALGLPAREVARWVADGPGLNLLPRDLDPAAVVRAESVEVRGGTPCFVPILGERRLRPVHLGIPGRHNVTNALVALAAVAEAGIDPALGLAGLEAFRGAERRFQILCDTPEHAVVDDYAHHPTEIEATLEAARQRFPDRALAVIYQPHQASRTREHLSDFGRVLARADDCLMTEIYYTRDREEDRRNVSSLQVAQEIERCGGRARFAAGLDEALPRALDLYRDKIVYLVMGAGDVFRVAEGLVRELSGRRRS